MSYPTNIIKSTSSLGIVSVNADTRLDAIVRSSVVAFERSEQRKGRQPSKAERDRVYSFNSSFLKKLQASIDSKLEILEHEADAYKKEIYDLLAEKYELLSSIRSIEKRIDKLEKAELDIFLEISEAVLKASYKFVKSSIKIVCGIAKDLITGRLPLSLSSIADRLSADYSNLAMETLADGINTILTITFEVVGEEGGIAGDALVGLAAAVNDVVSAACSGPVSNIVNGVKEVSKAALAQPGDALKEFATKESLKYASLSAKQVKEYNDISEASGVRGFLRESSDAVQRAQDIPQQLEDAVTDTAMDAGTALAKEGLAVAAQGFPAIKAGAAIAVGVANIYASFCDSVADMPILQTIGSSADKAKANKTARSAKEQAEIDRLEADIAEKYKQYDRTNEAIISSLNNHTATSMQIVQYSFTATWLIKSCSQISALANAYPYMNRDELLTLYWARIGDALFLQISALVDINMFSMMLRGFMEYLDNEISYKGTQCPLIDKDLELQLKQKWGLDRTSYCKFMSRIEVRSFIEQYKQSRTAPAPKQVSSSIDLDAFVSQYRSTILDKTKQFNQRFFARSNLFNSYAIKGANAADSSLTPMQQGYYSTDLDAANLAINKQLYAKSNRLLLPGGSGVGMRLVTIGVLAVIGTLLVVKKHKRSIRRYK